MLDWKKYKIRMSWRVFTNKEDVEAVIKQIKEAFTLSEEKVEVGPIIYEIVD